MTRMNVVEAKKHFSDLLGRVAYAGETIVITRHGRPMAKLAPIAEPSGQERFEVAKGWLDDDDPFFAILDEIAGERSKRVPRVFQGSKED